MPARFWYQVTPTVIRSSSGFHHVQPTWNNYSNIHRCTNHGLNPYHIYKYACVPHMDQVINELSLKVLLIRHVWVLKLFNIRK